MPPRADVSALEEFVLRVSALASGHDVIREMDCNPVMVGEARAVVVDSRVRVSLLAHDPIDELEMCAEEVSRKEPSADPLPGGVPDRLCEPGITDQ